MSKEMTRRALLASATLGVADAVTAKNLGIRVAEAALKHKAVK